MSGLGDLFARALGRGDAPAGDIQQGPPQQSPPTLSAARMAAALTAADLRAHGLEPELDQPAPGVEDDDGNIGVYCTWTRVSGAHGGIELDLWSNEDPRAVAATILADTTGEMSPAGLAGADESLIGLSVRSGFGPFATILVTRGELVFTLAIPTGERARDQLMGLAAVVLERLS